MASPLLRQIYAAIGIICLYFTNGYLLGLQSVIVPSLRQSSIQLSQDQESWIPSANILIGFPSQFIGGILTDRYGRKYILSMHLVPFVITGVVLFYAQDFNAFLAAFLVAGIGGAGMATGAVLVAEVCSPKYRGLLLNVKTVSFSVGIATAHLLSKYWNWRSLVLLMIAPSIFGIATTLSIPESPPWLAYKRRFKKCREAFYWFRGEEEEKELHQLVESQKNKKMIEPTSVRNNIRFVKIMKYLFDKSFLKAVYLNISITLCVECSGKQIFISYAFDIVNSIVNDPVYAYYYVFCFDLVDIITLIVSCFVVSKFKRRTLLFWLAIPAVVLLYLICLISYLLKNNIIPGRFSWVSLALVYIYFIILSIGVTPTLYSVIGEIFPLSHRGIGVSIGSFIFAFFLFIVTKISPALLRSFGVHGTFLINATITSVALLHLYFYLPETDKKTLQEIENEMKNYSDSVNDINKEMKERMLQTPSSSLPAVV